MRCDTSLRFWPASSTETERRVKRPVIAVLHSDLVTSRSLFRSGAPRRVTPHAKISVIARSLARAKNGARCPSQLCASGTAVRLIYPRSGEELEKIPFSKSSNNERYNRLWNCAIICPNCRSLTSPKNSVGRCHPILIFVTVTFAVAIRISSRLFKKKKKKKETTARGAHHRIRGASAARYISFSVAKRTGMYTGASRISFRHCRPPFTLRRPWADTISTLTAP